MFETDAFFHFQWINAIGFKALAITDFYETLCILTGYEIENGSLKLNITSKLNN